MAQFIAQIREEEAKQDEEEYWRTHNIARYKRDLKAFVNTMVANAQAIQISAPLRKGGGGGGEDDDF